MSAVLTRAGWNWKGLADAPQLGDAGAHAVTVARNHQAHIHTELAQRPGQSAGKLCRPADLGKWHSLGSHDQDLQWAIHVELLANGPD